MNKVTLIGHVGADPECRYSQSGKAVANLRVATNERYHNNGTRVQRTEWHRVVAFGKLAESVRDYLKKGRQVAIEGRNQTRQWEDKEGVKRYTTEIVAKSIEFLGSAPKESAPVEGSDDGDSSDS